MSKPAESTLEALRDRLIKVYRGFELESMNGVVCSIPDEGLDTRPHRMWCAGCQARYRELRQIGIDLDALLLVPPQEKGPPEGDPKGRPTPNLGSDQSSPQSVPQEFTRLRVPQPSAVDPEQTVVMHLLQELKPGCCCAVCEVLREHCEETFGGSAPQPPETSRHTDEPTDAEVDEAIDMLAERARRSVGGSSGHAWNREAGINRQADLLKRALRGSKRSKPPERERRKGDEPPNQ